MENQKEGILKVYNLDKKEVHLSGMESSPGASGAVLTSIQRYYRFLEGFFLPFSFF